MFFHWNYFLLQNNYIVIYGIRQIIWLICLWWNTYNSQWSGSRTKYFRTCLWHLWIRTQKVIDTKPEYMFFLGTATLWSSTWKKTGFLYRSLYMIYLPLDVQHLSIHLVRRWLTNLHLSLSLRNMFSFIDLKEYLWILMQIGTFGKPMS